MKSFLSEGTKRAKQAVIAVIGFLVLAAGLAMIVLPGPAVIVIPVGLGILATEFLWAESLLNKIKARFQKKNHPSADPEP